MSYINTFITVAEDCPVKQSELPKSNRKPKPVHILEYELLMDSPYHYDHYSLIFEVYLIRKDLKPLALDEKQALWDHLFSKGHPCLRASALTKRYGFGAHYNEEGKIALVPMESQDYQEFTSKAEVKKIAAMRSKRISKSK